MTHTPIRNLVIVGGGTAGWMMAAAAGRFLDDGQRTITLVESDAIATIGVGEATIPPILGFNALLGIDEAEFLAATQGSFKLGIEFVGWRDGTDSYFHPFGRSGRDIEGVNFHQLWLKLRHREGIGPMDAYSAAAMAAAAGRFGLAPPDPRAPLSGMAHAYHFDATLYAAFLRGRATQEGVKRVEGTIAGVERDGLTGNVTGLKLADGQHIAGDFFVDCSGFRSILLGGALDVPFEDWSHWLPCDRAIAVPSARSADIPPFTRATARPAGWQWRIPLQHRTGNGHVYASRFMADDEAEALLLAHLDTAPTADPRRLQFTAGVRQRLWDHNVVALGLSGGFLEPLESTSIHLVQQGISKLLALFPDSRITPVERDEYNRLLGDAYRSIRDFIILHYHATHRDDSPFWRYVRTMPVPETLAHKLALFREKGRIFRYDDELFTIPSWVAVMLGQGIIPDGYDPIVDALDDERVAQALRHWRSTLMQAVHGLPSHDAVLRQIVRTGARA